MNRINSLSIYFLLVVGQVKKFNGYEITMSRTDSSELRLLWNVKYAEARVDFRLEIFLPETDESSVIGFGMSDRGHVVNADVLIVRWNEDGVKIEDSWSDGKGIVHKDPKQDYHLKEYDVRGGKVSVSFWRLFDTHDAHDYKLDYGTTHLFYLEQQNKYGSGYMNLNANFTQHLEELLSFLDGEIKAVEMKHGTVLVQLLKPEIPASYFGQEIDVLDFSVLQPGVVLPPQVTSYWCSIHKLPESIQQKVHVVGFDAAISENSVGIVHHMEVFMCDDIDNIIPPYTGPCDVGDEPSKAKRCNRVMAAWAMGANAFFYPKEAGMPFGGSEQSRYLRLEVHYHNPLQKSGIVDSSGITFYYTQNLREFDAGIMEIGVTYTPNLAIPPGVSDFVLSGHCAAQCTSEGLQEGGIKIFGSQLHTHLAGTRVWTSHYRDGEKLPELNRDNHYTTWFEEIRHIYPHVDVLPGDSLVTFCSYDTSQRRNVTLGGLGMFEEMCVNYVHYYPVSSLEVCKSSVSKTSLIEYFTLEKLFTGFPRQLNIPQIWKNYDSIPWNENTISSLQTMYDDAPLDIECHQHNGSQFPGRWEDIYSF